MAETFYVMNNFPQEILDELRAVFENKEYDVTKEVVPGRFWHYCLNDKSHPVYRHFSDDFDMIEFYSVSPGFKNSPHLDRGRWCALNIPLDVDLENSFFYAGKYFHTHHYEWDTKKNESNSFLHEASEHGPKGFYLWDEDKMEKYNLEKPVLFSSKVPHGGNNVEGKFLRTIVSIGATNRKYEEVLHRLPPEWF